MLKTTQNQLKKSYKEVIRNLKYAIYGKCYDCMGFQTDGYVDCEIKTCSLYPYRLKQNVRQLSGSLASFLSVLRRKIQCLEGGEENGVG